MRAIDGDKLIEGLKVVDKELGLKGLLPMIIQAINHQPTIESKTIIQCEDKNLEYKYNQITEALDELYGQTPEQLIKELWEYEAVKHTR